MERTTDVAVVGAGIMGAATTWHLARRGHRVSLFEQYDLNHQRGSSHGYTRIFRLAYDYEQLDYVRLAQNAVGAWREAEEALGTTLLRQPGVLDIGEREWVEPFMRACQDAGVPHEWLTRSDVLERFEGYRLPESFGAMYQPDGGWIYAETARLGFIRQAEELGAQVHAETPILRITPHEDRVILETGDGTLEAGRVVLTTAGWTPRLIEPLGLHVTINVTREQVSFFPYRELYPLVPSMWHVDAQTFLFFVLPNGRGHLVKAGLHNVGARVDPDSDAVLDVARVHRLVDVVRERLPLVVPEPQFNEMCLYASSPDDDFILDRIGPLVLGFGFGSHGFKYGPLIGSFLADLVEGKSIPYADRFSYARFEAAPAI